MQLGTRGACASAVLSFSWLTGGSDQSLPDYASCVADLKLCSSALASEGRSQEDVAFGILQTWLMELYTKDPNHPKPSLADDVRLREGILTQLFKLANVAISTPALALGVGQMLHMFFWWGGRESLEELQFVAGPNTMVAAEALKLLELTVRNAGCTNEVMSKEDFVQKQCLWRCRQLFLIGVELAHHLAVRLRDLATASNIFRRLSSHLENLRRLPYLQGYDMSSPYLINTNREFFPSSMHWPVWPRSAWPSFGHFLEDNFDIFKQGLDGLLAADPAGELFRMTSIHQSEMAPKYEDWSRMNLVNSAGPSELCSLVPALRPTCELLASRPEINDRCETYLAGAAFAKLMPGAQVKPHFDTNGRLAAHLGLHTPFGASMKVGGERVIWEEGKVVVFDDTYVHSVSHLGQEPRYLLISWFCHPCDTAWRDRLSKAWKDENPLPDLCGMAEDVRV